MTDELKPDYLQPGFEVRGYRILDRVGAGGFGALYKVEANGRIYALKLSKTRFSELSPEEQQRQEERAAREIVALKSLNHPNIVRAYEFGRWPELEDGYPYIIMDFIDGYRLYDWRDRTTPSLRSIAMVFLKIARALNEMHRVHIVHRDLKSENVLVRSDGEPVIVDFGISKPKSSYTMTAARSMLGTYTHFSPEYAAWVLADKEEKTDKFPFGPPQELHCIGYMLYELLSGKAPFDKTDPYEASLESGILSHSLLFAIRDLTPPRPSTINSRIPGRLEDICMRLLEKKPELRHQSGNELAEDLERLLELADESWDQPFDVPARPKKKRPANTANERDRSPQPTPPSQVAALPPSVVVGGAAARSAEVAVLSSEGLPPAPPQPATRPVSEVAPVSVVTRPPGPAGFSPPTMEGAQFAAPEAPGEAGPVTEKPTRPELPSVVRRLAPQLEASVANEKRKKMLPLALAGLFVLVLVGYLALLNSSAGIDEKPRSLLTDVQEAPTASTPSPSPAPTLAIAPVPVATAPAPAPAPAVAAPDSELQVVPAAAQGGSVKRPRRMNEDEANIDRLLEESYGRPKVESDEQKEPPKPAGPAWLKSGQVVAAAAPAKDDGRMGIPMGAHIRARLKSNLDSRTIANGPVEAVLLRPYVQSGVVVLPSHTMLYGRASASGGRFVVQFATLRLPDRREVPFKAIAMDREDGKPGLHYARRIAGSGSKQDSVAGQVLKDTANTLLSKVGGDAPQDVARNAGERVVNQQGGALGGSEDAILLDSGIDFDVFVEEAF